MAGHFNDKGEFQSDKYPTCPPDKVPLSVNDPTAQDLLWQYAARRRAVDEGFANDLQGRLWNVGYCPPPFDCLSNAMPGEPKFTLLGRDAVAATVVKQWAALRHARLPNLGTDQPEEMAQIKEALDCAKAMEAYAAARQQKKNRERIAGQKAAAAAEPIEEGRS